MDGNTHLGFRVWCFCCSGSGASSGPVARMRHFVQVSAQEPLVADKLALGFDVGAVVGADEKDMLGP